MSVFDWLFSIEGRTVWVTGNNSLLDLRIAIIGFTEALRFVEKQCDENQLLHGFQQYIQDIYDIPQTAKSWARIITESSKNAEQAMCAFYKHLHQYHSMLSKDTTTE